MSVKRLALVSVKGLALVSVKWIPRKIEAEFESQRAAVLSLPPPRLVALRRGGRASRERAQCRQGSYFGFWTIFSETYFGFSRIFGFSIIPTIAWQQFSRGDRGMRGRGHASRRAHRWGLHGICARTEHSFFLIMFSFWVFFQMGN